MKQNLPFHMLSAFMILNAKRMARYRRILIWGLLMLTAGAVAQERTFTRQDTLRGSITPQRAWWDLLWGKESSKLGKFYTFLCITIPNKF